MFIKTASDRINKPISLIFITMLKIRLSRTGRKNAASYRLVVANQRDKRNGESLAILGFYDPKTKPATIVVNKDETKEWLKKGAQPTDTARAILVKQAIMPKLRKLKKYNLKPGKKAQDRAANKSETASK